MGSEINQLLEELHGAGLLESKGEFSIDFLKASAKLATRRLPDSRMYILRLIQSAVSGGGQQIEVEHSFKTVSFRGLGWTLPFEQLQELYNFLLKNSLDVETLPAQYLATAVNAALNQNPQRLHLVCWDGQAGISLSFVGQQERFERLEYCPFRTNTPQTCFTIVHRESWFFKKLPELEWLRKQCTFCPVPITINGSPLAPNFGEIKDLQFGKLYLPYTYVSSSYESSKIHVNNGHHMALGLVRPEVGDCDSELLVVTPLASSELEIQPPTGATTDWRLLTNSRVTNLHASGQRVRAAIGLRADLKTSTSARFVIHGVTLDPVPLETRHPGIEAVAVGSGLATDLSGCKIVESDLRHRLRYLEIAADELGEKFLNKWGGGDGYEASIAFSISGSRKSIYARF